MNREELKRSLKNDKRTKDQVFDDLCEQMRDLMSENGTVSPSRAEQEKAARNLIGYFEALMKPPAD